MAVPATASAPGFIYYLFISSYLIVMLAHDSIMPVHVCTFVVFTCNHESAIVMASQQHYWSLPGTAADGCAVCCQQC
jgi:hypothetical protein